EPAFVVLHPKDWWKVRLQKDAYGRYILGDPQQPGAIATTGGLVRSAPNIFNLTPVVTTSMSQGSFLVGTGDIMAVELKDRIEMQLEVSTSHSTFFTQNLLAIRAEKRACLVVRRPNSFVFGTFSTSP